MHLKAALLRSTIAGLSILLTMNVEVRADDGLVRVDWMQLGPHVTGRKVATVLADGTTVKGRVMAVKPDALAIRIGQTSAPTKFRDTAEVPRTQLTSFRVSRPGWKWRVIIPIAGFAAGALMGGLIGDRVDPHGFLISDGAATGVAFGAIGGGALGYVVGHFADRHTTVVEIVDGRGTATGPGAKAQ